MGRDGGSERLQESYRSHGMVKLPQCLLIVSYVVGIDTSQAASFPVIGSKSFNQSHG